MAPVKRGGDRCLLSVLGPPAPVPEDPGAGGGHLSAIRVVHGALVEGTGHHHVVHLL